MSADNWTTCLGCEKATEEAIKAQGKRIRDAYGLPFDEYEHIRIAANDEIEKLRRKTSEETFREDYEFYGADTGTVYVSYSGRCTVCGYGVSFESEHPIPDKVKGS